MPLNTRTVKVIGLAGTGKATVVGCMLFKYGGIPMDIMERFQREGVTKFAQVPGKLAALGVAPDFDIPKYHVSVIESNDKRIADCTIVVVTPDTLPEILSCDEVFTAALREMGSSIVMVNKMDTYGWSEVQFLKCKENFAAYLASLGKDVASFPIIPVSSIDGDNFVEPSSRSAWYMDNFGPGTTVLNALDTQLAT